MLCDTLKHLTLRAKTPIYALEAEETLFNRRFTFTDKDNKVTKSRWVQEVRYLETEGAIEICFTRSVVQAITRLDGAEEFYPVFTKPNRQFNERLRCPPL